MNLTMNEIIEKDQEATEVVDAQISHVHKGQLMDIEGITRQVCECGRVGDENGNLDFVVSKGSFKALTK